MSHENPTWVTEILKMMDEAKSNKSKFQKKQKISNKKIIPGETIVLSAKEDGLLWFEMLKTLQELKSKNEIISFPLYFENVCRKFSITKAKAWNCLFFLAEFGLVEIVKCHGIKLKYEINN